MTSLTTIIDSKFRLANWTVLQSELPPSFPSANLIRYYDSLATDTENVRERLAAYGNDLISLGVDGFRLDAAKSNL